TLHLRGSTHRQARLAATTGAGQREQACAGQQPLDLGQLAATTDKAGDVSRKVCGMTPPCTSGHFGSHQTKAKTIDDPVRARYALPWIRHEPGAPHTAAMTMRGDSSWRCTRQSPPSSGAAYDHPRGEVKHSERRVPSPPAGWFHSSVQD